jgi:amidase
MGAERTQAERSGGPADLDACGQAELVRRGALAPSELVEAAIARIERLNPRLNAVIAPLFEQARAVAAAGPPPGPFRGVPFLLKDLGVEQAGTPYCMGNRALRDAGFRSRADSALGARFRAAGLVTLGKTNTPEFGSATTTQPEAFGPTRNPWDPERSSGGSSGGSAAAVAAGLVPMAHANDGGGSIRIPASFCGLVGLKPTRGRVPVPTRLDARIACDLVVCRTLRDAAAALDAVHGGEPGAPWPAAPPARAYREEVGAAPGRLRVGLLARPIGGLERVHPECRAAAEGAARLLEALGHRVEEAAPEALHDAERGARTLPIAVAELRAQLAIYGEETLGRALEAEEIEPLSRALRLPGLPAVTAEQYLVALEWEQRWVGRVARWWREGFDLLLTPTVGEPPPRLAEMQPDEASFFAVAARFGAQCAYTQPFNLTGQPALSLPLHWTPEGLPVGVQLVADVGREDLLLRVGAQLEQARPWQGRRPAIHA